MNLKTLGNRTLLKMAGVARRSRAHTMLAAAGLRHASSINTFTTKAELEALLQLATQVPEETDAVEVGSYLGASTCYITAGLFGKQCRLTCIDTWQNETMPEGERDTMAVFNQNLLPVADMLRVFRSRSNELRPDALPRSITFAFLDGDHSYESAKSDFALVEARVADGGIVAFHDTLHFQGVSMVLGEALASGAWRLEGCCNNLSWIRKSGFYSGDAKG